MCLYMPMHVQMYVYICKLGWLVCLYVLLYLVNCMSFSVRQMCVQTLSE